MANADRIIELLHEAKARPAGAVRDQFLTEACQEDAALKEQIVSLLAAEAGDSGSFLKITPVLRQPLLPTEKPGDCIGRYKLLQQIGEGGCGVVYMAEQEEPVRRRVALKVIKLGMDTKSVIARFEAERQALALMDHPNIAKVLDAGATDTGRPYFVMELVRGIRITDYCDQNNLSTVDRLKLFTQVCHAIQHAHQKGIIHRDIKPSNILVTISEPGATGSPKVIDFGIAKATNDQRLTDKTIFTAFEQFIGTPAYMSPEQAMMTSLDIDTRTDIYALGVLLYELLTGRTPFDAAELMAVGLDAMRRIISEQEPARPSTRLSTMLAADLTTVARHRQAEPARLGTLLRGDLDWIVMKALEKERSRRYETASGLAADVQRHLSNEPVVARPPSGWYLLQKLMHRRRGALVMAGTILLALIVAVVTLATSNSAIRRERNEKDGALRDRSAALEASREQLFVSLQSQAQARRNSRQMGQRLESLAALTGAARIRTAPELRDNAIAAMAIPDVQLGPSWAGWNPAAKGYAYDSVRERYARLDPDGALTIRTVPDDRELQRLEPDPLTVGAKHGELKFSPDGRYLAWLDELGRLRVWRWESGETIWKSPAAACSALAFSPDGRRLAVGQEAWIICFELANGEETRRWQARDLIFRMDFHPDSRQLAVGYQSAGAVAVYNADDGERVANLPTGGSAQTVVSWHPDGELLAAGGSDSRVQIWNVETRRKVALLEGHVGPVSHLSFHARGDLLASLAVDGVMRLWQPSPGRLLMRLPQPPWIAFGGAGRWAGAITPSRGQAQLWGIVPSEEYHTFLNPFGAGESHAIQGDISSDGRLLALGTTDGVRLWDIARGRQVSRLPMGETTTVLFCANGRELLTCGPTDGLQRWGVESDSELDGGLRLGPPHRISLPFAPRRIALGRGDGLLAVAGESAGEAVLLELATEVIRAPAMAHDFVSYIALGPEGERLATSGWHSEVVKLWDGPGGKLIKEWRSGKLSRAFITPDGREMIIARPQDITFYDLISLKESRRLPRDLGLYPGFIAFAADGKLMALEMAPGIIHLKETSSGRTVAKLEDPHGDQSTWLGFTPDSAQLIVVAQSAGAVHRWDLRAIRARLQKMNLDWDWPALSSPSPADASFSKRRRLLRVRVMAATPSATNAPPAAP